MLNQEQIIAIENSLNLGVSKVEIAKNMAISIATVYKYAVQLNRNNSNLDSVDNYIEAAEEAKILIPTILVPYLGFIDELTNHKVYNASKIFQQLKSSGFSGSYSIVNDYIRKLQTKNHPNKTRAYQRVETAPGEQAQVDWGHVGKIEIGGHSLNLYVFVYVLSYSRMMYAEFVTTQKQRVLQECHMHAFDALGAPKKIRYDNMKTVVTSRQKVDGKECINYNFDFLNFAHHYHFVPEACPQYYPRSKGKVEAGVKYIKNNFLNGEVFKKTFASVEELNIKVLKWLDQIANNRIHGTTRERPIDLWPKEKEHLLITVNYPRYQENLILSRRASQNSMIAYKRSSYWVPQCYARKKINIVEVIKGGMIKIELYFRTKKIIEYSLALKIGSWVLPENFGKDKNKERREKREILNIEVTQRDPAYYNKFLNL